VNGKRVNIPSYQLKNDDVVEIKQKSKELAFVLEASVSPERDVPDYLEVDHKAMKGKFLRAPALEDVPFPVTMEPNMVTEFYSR
jgi:small subunit ribosomal protein S4